MGVLEGVGYPVVVVALVDIDLLSIHRHSHHAPEGMTEVSQKPNGKANNW